MTGRHSYATAAPAAGVPAKIVSERLGHAKRRFCSDACKQAVYRARKRTREQARQRAQEEGARRRAGRSKLAGLVTARQGRLDRVP